MAKKSNLSAIIGAIADHLGELKAEVLVLKDRVQQLEAKDGNGPLHDPAE